MKFETKIERMLFFDMKMCYNKIIILFIPIYLMKWRNYEGKL